MSSPAPKSDNEQCPVCSGGRWRDDRTARRVLALPDPYRILRCRRCGTSKLYPPLTGEEARDLYGQSYFTLGGEDPGILDSFQHTSEVRVPKFRRTIAQLKMLHPAGRSVLDVGAATGDFVLVARAEGLEVDGVEHSRAAVSAAARRGVNLLEGDLASVSKQYDYVHLNHVFEHFRDPAGQLEAIRRVMAPGALVYIEIPYQFNAVERLQLRFAPGRFRCSVHSFHHPYMYTPRSMRTFLQRAGFRVLRLRVFDPDRYPSDTLRSRLKQSIWAGLSRVGIGNYVEIIATAREASRRENSAQRRALAAG